MILMGMRCFEELFALMKEFSSTLKPPMALYWNSYLKMVDLMLCFIRASRVRCWILHLSALLDMLPWFQAYNRTNYARYGALYWSEMVVLEKVIWKPTKQLMQEILRFREVHQGLFLRLQPIKP